MLVAGRTTANAGMVQVEKSGAAILALPGFDREWLTFRLTGRDFRLTNIHEHVVKELMA